MATEASPRGLLDEAVDWRHKAFAAEAGPVELSELRGRDVNALGGDLIFPLLLVKNSAVEHNIALMASFARERGLSLAPHAKTTMAPQIFLRELAAGAWGLTAQTIAQARVYREFGVSRILLANQLLQGAALRWVAAELEADPDFEFYCLVDSVAGVRLMTAALAENPPARRLRVLLELGMHGGRAGCRGLDEAKQVAAAVADSRVLALAGVEAFDGVLTTPEPTDETLAAVDKILDDVTELVGELASLERFAADDEIVVSVGSSAFFDRTAAVLGAAPGLEQPVRVVMRCGAYVTHDGLYWSVSPLDGRRTGSERLLPALEAWGMVLSRPEPELAIVGFGKRDVPYDVALPRPTLVRRGSGELVPAEGLEVVTVNDHHAFVRIEGTELDVGDLIGCSVSHACTAFDKWTAIPLVADDYRVLDVVRTFF
jgi:D-serine dehydratase